MYRLKQIAEKMDGVEYLEEEKRFRNIDVPNGTVIVFGASDDLMEFMGAIDVEIVAYRGAIAYVDSEGIQLNPRGSDRCENCHLWIEKKTKCHSIEQRWRPEETEETPSWDYVTDIPHEVFNVMEDGEVFCRGIVFNLNNLKQKEEIYR